MLFCYCFVFSQNQITISSITINGNKITKEDIILREVVFSKNSSFSTADLDHKIKESQENLINLKLFNFVEINYTLTGDKAQLTIDVTERWYFWPYPVFEISERNFNTWWQEFKTSSYSDFSYMAHTAFFLNDHHPHLEIHLLPSSYDHFHEYIDQLNFHH